MCEEAVENEPDNLKFVPDKLKTQKMCNKAVEDDTSSLEYVPYWFVTQEQLDIWYDDYYWYYDDGIIKWYKGYQKCKAQKAKIKEELLPIAWHPDHVINWCVSEDVMK